MTLEIQQQELRTIHCYDAVSFVIEVEKAVKDGFSLDLVTPLHYPVQIGYQYIATMVKGSVDDKKEPVKAVVECQEKTVAQDAGQSSQEQSQEVVEVPKRAGRAAKGAK